MLIVANWKMNLNIKEAESLAVEFISLSTPKNEIVIAPSYTFLHKVSNTISNSKIKLAAQNCFYEESGAYTGEVSPGMLKEIGCEYAILGHSERRNIFGETSELVARKSSAVRKVGVTPIICVGETLEERESGKTNDILAEQLRDSVPENFTEIDYVIAYEPVWAIGTGKVASKDDISSAHEHIANISGKDARIIYGGSVNDENCKDIAMIDNVSGMLVGGASLSSDKFSVIMNV